VNLCSRWGERGDARALQARVRRHGKVGGHRLVACGLGTAEFDKAKSDTVHKVAPRAAMLTAREARPRACRSLSAHQSGMGAHACVPPCVHACLISCLPGLCVCSHTRVAIVAKQHAFEALQALSLTDPQLML
jgi:hypothetical protein